MKSGWNQTTVERSGDTLIVKIPMQFKKRGGRREIIGPEGFEAAGEPRAPAQEPLVVALARAHRWQELLDSSRHPRSPRWPKPWESIVGTLAGS